MTLLKEYTLPVAGSFVAAISIALFMAPNGIATGGASGVGIVLYSGFSIPVSITVSAINVVLFIVGYRLLDKRIIAKTLISTIALATFIEILSHFEPLTNDILIASSFGGLILGIGTGLVISSGASTGGSDFAAMLIHKKISHLSVATLIFIIDFAIIAISWYTANSLTTVFYAFLGLFITIKTIDFIVEGSNFSKLIYIISTENEDICQYIIANLKRGVTAINAKGGYSSKGKTVLLCAVSSRQFPMLKKYVLSKDKDAFIILSDARSVYGKGFKME
ncbi:MAG: YitT family protein [Clostridia bacterium]|nr:YitT family protein [Clostridia bacterium]